MKYPWTNILQSNNDDINFEFHSFCENIELICSWFYWLERIVFTPFTVYNSESGWILKLVITRFDLRFLHTSLLLLSQCPRNGGKNLIISYFYIANLCIPVTTFNFSLWCKQCSFPELYFFSNLSSMWPHILLWRMAYRENPHYFLSHEWKVVSSSPTPLVGCPPSSQILMIFLPFKERYFFCLQSMLAEMLSWGTLNIYFWNAHKYVL